MLNNVLNVKTSSFKTTTSNASAIMSACHQSLFIPHTFNIVFSSDCIVEMLDNAMSLNEVNSLLKDGFSTIASDVKMGLEKVEKEALEAYPDDIVKMLKLDLCNKQASNYIAMFNSYLGIKKCFLTDMSIVRKHEKNNPVFSETEIETIKSLKTVAMNNLKASMNDVLIAIECIRNSLISGSFSSFKFYFHSLFNVNVKPTTFNYLRCINLRKSGLKLTSYTKSDFSDLFMMLMTRVLKVNGGLSEKKVTFNICDTFESCYTLTQEEYNNLETDVIPNEFLIRELLDVSHLKDKFKGNKWDLKKAKKAVLKKSGKTYVVSPHVDMTELKKTLKKVLLETDTNEKKKKEKTN